MKIADMNLELNIVSEGERLTPSWLVNILGQLKLLGNGSVLQISAPSRKNAEQLVTRLIYYKNKRHRKLMSSVDVPLKDYAIARRNRLVFLIPEEIK